MKKVLAFALVAACGGVASAAVLGANPAPANNGGSSGWAIFSDFTSLGNPLSITHMTTASSAAAGGAFTVEVFVFNGSGLSAPGSSVATGPGSSSTGWTSLGVANATQGAAGSTGVSELIDIPDISVGAGQTVGVAFLFGGAGPRYFGTGAAPILTFADAELSLDTGNARSAPFTTGGSLFASRGHVGEFTYEVIPAPASLALVGLGGLVAGRRRR